MTLELGTRPDWLNTAFPSDEEWKIEFSKFYYGLNLAWAFCETGEEIFLQTWEDLVRSWIEQVPAHRDPSDVTGRRIQNWIYAWNRFSQARAFSQLREGLDELILSSINEQVEHLRGHLSSERNHRTLELYGLFVAALALPEIDHNSSLLQFSMDELHRNLLSELRSDGVHREGSTHYHMIVLRSFLAARWNAELFHLSFPNGYDEHLKRACEFAMHCHRPDGLIPAVSDADTGSYLDLLELAASLFSRRDFLFVATRGLEGSPPRETSGHFPKGGYFIQRSGWGEGLTAYRDERFLIFDCGPLGDGGHGHYDALSVEVTAHGQPLIIDPGRFTYHEGEPNWRRWFKSTAAHNTVCIDRTDQTPYRSGKPKGPVAVAKLEERMSAPNLDLLCGTVKSPSYEAIHTRFIFFIAGEYWVIVDHVRGERLHEYDLRFHLSPNAMNRTVVGREKHPFVAAPELVMVFNDEAEPQIETGWCAPKYGVKVPAPVISARINETKQADFVTLVSPTSINDFSRTFRIFENKSDYVSFEVFANGANQAVTDVVTWSASPHSFSTNLFTGKGRVTWSRIRADLLSAFCACDVELDQPVKNIQSFRWLTWDEPTRVLQFDQVLRDRL